MRYHIQSTTSSRTPSAPASRRLRRFYSLSLGSSALLGLSVPTLRAAVPVPITGVYELQPADITQSGTITISGTGILRKTGTWSAYWPNGPVAFALSPGANIEVLGGVFIGGILTGTNWSNNQSHLTVASGAYFSVSSFGDRVDGLFGAGQVDGSHGLTIGVAGGNGSFSGVISGSTLSLTKVGAGTQTLTGANTFGGGLTVNDGFVAVSANSGLGAAAGSVTLNGGGIKNTAGTTSLGRPVTLGAPGGTLDTTGGNLAWSGVLSGSGELRKTGANQLTLSGTNTHTGGVRVSQGALVVSSGAALGSGKLTIDAIPGAPSHETGFLQLEQSLTINCPIEVAGGGVNPFRNVAGKTLTLNGPLTDTSDTVLGGLSMTSSSADNGTIIATSSVSSTDGLILDGIGLTWVFGGDITTSLLRLTRPSVVAELHAPTNRAYAGNTIFYGGGVLRKTGAGQVSWSGKANFQFGSNALSGGRGLIDVQAGRFLAGDSENDAQMDVWSDNKADLQVAAGAEFAAGYSTVYVDALTGSGTIRSGYSLNPSPIFFGVDNGSGTFAGTLAGNLGSGLGYFFKYGTGTQILSGASTYNGLTTVNAGALLVTGSLGNTLVSVVSGATFGGTGSLGGTLTIGSGARLALGVAPSLIRGLAVSGSASLNGAITVVAADLGGSLVPGTYDLLTFSGSLGGSPTFTWEAPAGSDLVATFDTSTLGVVRITLAAPSALTPFEQWLEDRFGPGADPALTAPTADPDDDGLPNLLQYALGGLPAQQHQPGLAPVAGRDSSTGVLTLAFTRIADPGLRYIVEATGDLAAPVWTPLLDTTGPQNTAGVVTVHDTVAPAPGVKRFMRLRVELAP